MENHCRLVAPLCLALAVLLSGLSAGLLSVVGEAAPPPAAGPQGEEVWVVRAHYADRQMVNELATWIEPWEVHHEEGYLIVAVDQAGYQRMVAAGFRLEIEQELTYELNRPRLMLPGQVSGIPGYPCYRTVEETFAAAQDIATAHAGLATWIDAGDSWEKTQGGGEPGYDLMVLRLTNSAIPGPKPKLFVMASIHAREYTPAELVTRFAEYLVDNYDADPDVTWLLDYHEIHLLLQANPDGRKHAEAGDSWRKNTNENYCSLLPDHRGADLNRNFPFQWGCCFGSSTNACAETYRGPSAASEPETQAVLEYVRAEFPDQRGEGLSDPAPADATGVFLDMHSYSELVLWPWGFTSDPPPNSPALQTLGRKLAFFNSYYPEQAIGLYPTDGATDDFAYGELGLAAYTIEMGTDFFESCSEFENTILPANLPVLLYAAKAARMPYLTPAGPDTLNPAVAPAGAGRGQPIRLTATVDDRRYNNSNGSEATQDITAAEYYVDVPPWTAVPAPLPQAMMAVDGAFDEPAEDVEATIETGNLSPGRHILFVRGRDADDNWGAFSAVFVYVFEPAFRVHLPLVFSAD